MRSLSEKWLADHRFAAILIIFFTLMFSASNAYAHAALLRSQPANGEILRQIPKTIELTFNEELQVVNMNFISVTDQNGKRFDKKIVVISEDGKRMQTELEALSNGDYKVEWKALSADDHTIKGAFGFKVVLSGEAASIAPLQSNDARTTMTHQMPMQESGTNWGQSAARWLMYLALMTLFGGFAFRLLVLKPSLEQARDLSGEERAHGFAQGENRFINLIWASLALLAVTALASLVLQTSAVLDVSILQAFAPSRLLQVLNETSFGAPWLLQIALVISLLIVVFLIARRRNYESGQNDMNSRTTLLWIGFGLSAMLFLTPSLTGHARAAVREYQFAVLSDWLHLVAVGIWVGGIFHLALTMPKSIAHLHGVRRLCVLSRVIPLFSRLAIASSILIALTGIYNSWIHVESFSALLTTSYGQILSIKIVLFLPMIALGGLNSFVLRPRAERFNDEKFSTAEHLKTDRSFSHSIRIEATIGVVVLLLAAILAFLPPARQHEMTSGATHLQIP